MKWINNRLVHDLCCRLQTQSIQNSIRIKAARANEIAACVKTIFMMYCVFAMVVHCQVTAAV